MGCRSVRCCCQPVRQGFHINNLCMHDVCRYDAVCVDMHGLVVGCASCVVMLYTWVCSAGVLHGMLLTCGGYVACGVRKSAMLSCRFEELLS